MGFLVPQVVTITDDWAMACADDSTPGEIAEHPKEVVALLKARDHERRYRDTCVPGATRTRRVWHPTGLLRGGQSLILQHPAVLPREGLVRTRCEARAIHDAGDDDRAACLVAILHALFCCRACTNAPRRVSDAT